MKLTQIRSKMNPYWRLMRMDKPIGILLLLWPTLWGVWVASDGHPNLKVLSIFVFGTVLMRAAGCVMNDIADRRFDGLVERTKHRPLATGEVSVKSAILLASALSGMAFLLVLQTNPLTIQLSIAALFLAVSYPWTKRFFATPQAYLGVAFGFGIPMAFAAQTNQVPPIACWMLLANIFWSLAYDTAYAMVDRNDDIHLGIHSSALFFGRYEVVMIMGCYFLMLSLLTYVGVQTNLAWPYYVGLIVSVGLVVYHYTLIKTRNRMACFEAFLHNNYIGMTIFVGLVLSYLVSK